MTGPFPSPADRPRIARSASRLSRRPGALLGRGCPPPPPPQGGGEGAARGGEDGGALRLIYHGAIVERYGLDLALQAMARLREEAGNGSATPDIRLTLIGRGDYINTLVEMADDLGLRDQVDFHWDLVPVEDLPAIILESDAGIVPYRDDPFTDGLLPTKLMEYAALAMPAIAARTTAIERTFGGTMVELFEPGSVDDLARQMLRLYHDRDRLCELAAGADRFNREYNWTRVGNAYVALVKRLGGR